MAFAAKLRDLGNKAKNLAQGHPDQADRAVEKAGDEVGRRTGGKFDTQIDPAEDKADEFLGIGKDDRQAGGPGQAGGPDRPNQAHNRPGDDQQ
jgi:hypothetical protein